MSEQDKKHEDKGPSEQELTERLVELKKSTKAGKKAKAAKASADKNEKLGRMHFEVTPEQAPGVQRAGVGLFRPGQRFWLPDKASKPGDLVPTLSKPLNKAAEKAIAEALAAKESNRQAAEERAQRRGRR